jgi:hypothetical protein
MTSGAKLVTVKSADVGASVVIYWSTSICLKAYISGRVGRHAVRLSQFASDALGVSMGI